MLKEQKLYIDTIEAPRLSKTMGLPVEIILTKYNYSTRGKQNSTERSKMAWETTDTGVQRTYLRSIDQFGFKKDHDYTRNTSCFCIFAMN